MTLAAFKISVLSVRSDRARVGKKAASTAVWRINRRQEGKRVLAQQDAIYMRPPAIRALPAAFGGVERLSFWSDML
jgi:hypothetical protein